MYSFRASPPSASENFWVHTCSFFIQYGFQKSPCNLLWLLQAFYELCSILYVRVLEHFVVREIDTSTFVWTSEGAPKVQAPKIINGYPAIEGQFPHQGALLIDGSTFCGCSLLNPYYVLTAAHCAQGSVWTVMWQGPSSFILKSRVSNST